MQFAWTLALLVVRCVCTVGSVRCSNASLCKWKWTFFLLFKYFTLYNLSLLRKACDLLEHSLFLLLDVSVQYTCGVQTPLCVFLQLLAWAMWIKMKDTEGMLSMVGMPLSQHHQQHLSMLADFYYQIMVFGKGRETRKIWEVCRNWEILPNMLVCSDLCGMWVSVTATHCPSSLGVVQSSMSR